MRHGYLKWVSWSPTCFGFWPFRSHRDMFDRTRAAAPSSVVELLGHGGVLQKLKCAPPAVEVAREFELPPPRESFAKWSEIVVKTQIGTTFLLNPYIPTSVCVCPVKFSENCKFHSAVQLCAPGLKHTAGNRNRNWGQSNSFTFYWISRTSNSSQLNRFVEQHISARGMGAETAANWNWKPIFKCRS